MFRLINTKVWEDDWFFDLSLEEKAVFIYLITSNHTNQLGVYEANIKFIEIETKVSNAVEIIKKLYPKVIYIPEKKLLFVKNFVKYQNVAGSFEKNIYKKFIQLPLDIQQILFSYSEALREILVKVDPQLEKKFEDIPIEDPGMTPGRPGVYRGCSTDTVSDTETDTGYISVTDTESEKLIENNSSTNVDEQALREEKTTSTKKQKTSKPPKYPQEVVNFVKKFKEYRENYLKVPITHKDWHLKSCAVVYKLLKKYSLEELQEALADLQTEYWEDKVQRILELWHFEDWLPRWKIWKYPPSPVASGSENDNKYRRLYYEVYGKYPEE